MHSAGLTIKCLDLPEKEGGLGRCSTRKWQDGREARSRKECFTQNKRIQKVVAESEHEGDIVHTGWAGRNQGGGRRGPRGDSGGARMGMGAPANAAGRTGQLKEGTAASAEQHTGRPGQLACPEDTLVQLCRLPKAIWLTRTYLARQGTIMSARLPQPTLALSAKPPNSTLQPPLSLC